MAKAAKTNYVAKLNGAIVGTRASHRAYTHAVVIQWSEDHARTVAYGYKPTATDKSNFSYYTEVAAQGVDHPHYNREPWRPLGDVAGVERAKATIEGGYDAYVERLRQHQIDSFEASRANGFKPGVAAWNGRRDLAEKEASKYRGQDRVANVWIVEVETSAKPVKVVTERKHHAYGPRA
jgi:hypothetical protein